MSNVSRLNFMQPYNVIPQNKMKPGMPAMIDVDPSRQADPRDVQLFMNFQEKKGGPAEQIPVKYDDLKQALKESHGRAESMSLAHYLGKHYGNGVNVIGISLGMNHLPACGCVFSLYDNDSKICMRMEKY